MTQEYATTGTTRPITVTMTLEEWTAILARTTNQEMSLLGAKIYNRAAGSLSKQILDGAQGSNPTLARGLIR